MEEDRGEVGADERGGSTDERTEVSGNKRRTRTVFAELVGRTVLLKVALLTLTLSFTLLIYSLLLGMDVGEIHRFFLTTTLGSLRGFLMVLARATPILITTLGLMVAFKGGLWNIGGEGQIILGIIVTTGICLFLSLPPVLAILLSFIFSFLVSGGYGGIAGWLRARWRVNEIAVTMMQTFVASALLQYLINGPWNWGRGLYPRTEKIPVEARLPYVLEPLNVTFLLGVALTIILYLILQRTVFGYELRAMKSNRQAAVIYGIDADRLTCLSMLLSGGLCGVAGCTLVLGEYFRAQAGISGNYGFYAIAASLMVNNRPSLAPLSALFFAFIYQGVLGITALGVPHRMGEMLIGCLFIVILSSRMERSWEGD